MTPVPVPAPATGPDAGATWHYGDPLGEQRTAADSAVVVDRSHRAVLTLTGADRRSWLHTISTQHVSELPDGAVTENLNLDGQGRVEDHWLQTQLDDVTVLDTESQRGEPLRAYLTKMVFRADVKVDAADLAVLSLLGPAAADIVRSALDVTPPAPWSAVPLDGGGFVRTLDPGEVDVVTPAANRDDVLERLVAAGARRAGVWAYEAHRVSELQPRLGVDTDDRTIPHEVGWIGGPGEGAVHLNKGCYRGQETVARVHNVGKPPRMLALLHLDGSDDRPESGDPVLSDGKPVGRLGTVVDHVDQGPIALALLKRGLPADTPLVTGGEHAVPAVIDADTLPPADVVGAGRLAIQRLRSDRR
jgi:tRNA-modifying protein YgfZ